MANIFVVSDTHFAHANILTFTQSNGLPLREFASVGKMNEHIIERWNSVVRPQDKVYHVGDVSMIRPTLVAEQLNRLNGHLRLIRGNHDVYKTRDYLEFFDEVYGIRVLDNMILTHIPIHPASGGRFLCNIHGHIHDRGFNIEPAKMLNHRTGEYRWMPYINVTVEHLDNYTPVSIEDVKKQALKKVEELQNG